MSGIYIKGMAMPEACCACPCSYDNQCAVTHQYPTFEEWYEDKPDYCPLVPVPPHGRVIDADALIQDKGIDTFSAVFAVANAPTIIEAEEVE